MQALLTWPPGPGAGVSCTVNWMPGGRSEDVEPFALMASYAVSCTAGHMLISAVRRYRSISSVQLTCTILCQGVLVEWGACWSHIISAQALWHRVFTLPGLGHWPDGYIEVLLGCVVCLSGEAPTCS